MALFIPPVGSVAHSEEYEMSVAFALTAAPQTQLLGRSITNVGRTIVPFNVMLERNVFVPPGVYGDLLPRFLNYQCKAIEKFVYCSNYSAH